MQWTHEQTRMICPCTRRTHLGTCLPAWPGRTRFAPVRNAPTNIFAYMAGTHQKELPRKNPTQKMYPGYNSLHMTSVRFELTPFRTRALIWRLRPLGQLITERFRLSKRFDGKLPFLAVSIATGRNTINIKVPPKWIHFCLMCRRLHKQEMLEVRQQLKTASVSSKGGEKESDRLKKELDKIRYGKLTACRQA